MIGDTFTYRVEIRNNGTPPNEGYSWQIYGTWTFYLSYDHNKPLPLAGRD
jgi:hypothetical protein